MSDALVGDVGIGPENRHWRVRVKRGLAMWHAGWFGARMSDDHRSHTPSDEELLEELRRLLVARGKLSASLIEASEITRAPNTYIRRFGSLVAAYARVGYDASERQRATSERFRTQGGRPRPHK